MNEGFQQPHEFVQRHQAQHSLSNYATKAVWNGCTGESETRPQSRSSPETSSFPSCECAYVEPDKLSGIGQDVTGPQPFLILDTQDIGHLRSKMPHSLPKKVA